MYLAFKYDRGRGSYEGHIKLCRLPGTTPSQKWALWPQSDNVHFAPCKRIHEGPGFRIPASRFWIPTLWIPDSNLLDSGFQTIVDLWIPDSNSKNFAGFRIPDSLTWGDSFIYSFVKISSCVELENTQPEKALQ